MYTANGSFINSKCKKISKYIETFTCNNNLEFYNLIDKFYVRNLEKSVDRKSHIINEFKKVNINDYDFFKATDKDDIQVKNAIDSDFVQPTFPINTYDLYESCPFNKIPNIINNKTINYIKIFGERNSGTTFLHQLLEKNVKNVSILPHGYNSGTGWKHGFPKINLFNKIDNTLFIVIIRNVEDWLISMFKNQYHLKQNYNITSFLENKLDVYDKRTDHDVNVNPLEKQNILNLRYSKILSYLNLYKIASNIIFINLEDLQNNTSKFINFLSKTYNIDIAPNIIEISKHTKSKEIKKSNRSYNIDLPNIKNLDTNIELFVKNLKNKYYYKRS